MVPVPAPGRVGEIVASVRTSTGPWVELFRPDAMLGLATVVTVSAPELAHRDLVTLTSLGAWICAFDDMVDDSDVGDVEIEARIAQYEQLIHQSDFPALVVDPLAEVLKGVLDALGRAPLGRPLWPLLASQLVTACRAMRWERAAAAAHIRGWRTPLEIYLQHGADSICVGFVLTAAAMLIGEPAALSRVPALQIAQRHSAMAVRIANDLATWPREQTEVFAANALAFAGEASVDSLRARIDAERRALALALAGVSPALPRTAAFIRRFTDCFVTLYSHGDLTDADRWLSPH
jgi:hypothetical protein